MQHKSLNMSLIWQVTNYKKPYQVLCSYYTRHENLWQTVRFAFIPFTQQHFDSPSADTSILIASYISPPSVRISWQAEFNADVILRYLRGYISFFRCFSRSLFFVSCPALLPRHSSRWMGYWISGIVRLAFHSIHRTYLIYVYVSSWDVHTCVT